MKKTLTFLLLSTLIISCQNQKTSHDKERLKISFLTEVNSLDPRYGYEIPANFAVKMLFEGLVRADSSGKIVPALAESFEISDDGKNYTFHLRPSKWTNGEKVTAFDFEYSCKDVIDPKKPTQGKSDFAPIKNVEAIIAGKLPVEKAGIQALDENTLLVELENPTPYFLELLTTSVYVPLSKSYIEKHPHWAEKGGKEFVCNGPFYLKEWKKNDRIIFEKNPSYWNASDVLLKGIDVVIVEDAMTQLNLYVKGETDWFGKPFTKLPLDAVPTLREKGLLTYFPEEAVYLYFLNTEKYPFNNKKIRQAFSICLNREAIVSHVLKEDEAPALKMIRDDTNPHPYFQDGDPTKARTLFEEGLAELGIHRSDFPLIPLSYCSIETNHRIAQVVKEQIEKALCVKIPLDPQEWTTYYSNLSSGNCMMGGLSWHSRVNDPLYALQIFKIKEDRLNMSKWENPEYQHLLTKAQEELDPEKRKETLLEAEKLLMEEMPAIPIYFLTISYAKKSNLENVYISKTNELDFSRAYFR